MAAAGGEYSPQGISRGHHYAFRVPDIRAAEAALAGSGIVYWKITSPPNFLLTPEGTKVAPPSGTAAAEDVSQIFFFDPDGNGVEVGNFAPVQLGFYPIISDCHFFSTAQPLYTRFPMIFSTLFL